MKAFLVLGWGFFAAVIYLFVNIARDIRAKVRAERLAKEARRQAEASAENGQEWDYSPKGKEDHRP